MLRVYALMTLLFCILVPSWGAGVIVNFDPSTPTAGPFPTDFLTTPDPAQKTGETVNLPVPDCTSQPNACAEAMALNQLDGFAPQPRISIQFSGAIDPNTLQKGVLLIWLDNLTSDEQGLAASGTITSINQIIYDPSTNTAYAKPNDFFDQHRRYALVVTDAVHDAGGDPVQADPNFTACAQSPSSGYCTALAAALGNLSMLAAPQNVIAASIFTTMSATTWLEQVRDLVASGGPLEITRAGAIGPAGNITAVNFHAQVKANPAGFQDFPIMIPSGALAGVDRIVFSSYKSPNYLNAQQYIPYTPTATPITAAAATNDVGVHAYVPSSKMPDNGYPVVIFGHGFSENSLLSPTAVASNFAKAGFVVLAINAVGHGYGPQSVIQINAGGAAPVSFPSGGRGVDLDGDGVIQDYEGCVVTVPVASGLRDCLQQTVVDLLQLVHGVKTGLLLEDVNGVRLDSSKIYYGGISLGAIYGSILHAVTPDIQTAALVSGGGSMIDISRWTQASFLHTITVGVVGGRTPSLLNNGNDFNDNYALRDQAPLVNDVPGAIDIQNLFGNLEWLQSAGDPLSFATHLKLSPLPNVSAKQALFFIPQGDETVPNPQESNLIRAAGMLSSSLLYRSDTAESAAKQLGQTLSDDPHAFLVDISSLGGALVANAAQQVIVGYLNSDGATIPPMIASVSIIRLTLSQMLTGYLETFNWN